EIEERMAEGVKLVAVDVRDRTACTHLDIAAKQRHADGIAWLKRRSAFRFVAPSGTCQHWREAGTPEHRRHELGRRSVQPDTDERGGDRMEQRSHFSAR